MATVGTVPAAILIDPAGGPFHMFSDAASSANLYMGEQNPPEREVDRGQGNLDKGD